MATYKNYSELQGNILKDGDRVIFDHDGYRIETVVYNITLGAENYEDIETKIFKLLRLEPYEFCEQHYIKLHRIWDYRKTHYPDRWPPYCDEDYESATKVVLELFRLIEEIPRQLKETSETLFID